MKWVYMFVVWRNLRQISVMPQSHLPPLLLGRRVNDVDELAAGDGQLLGVGGVIIIQHPVRHDALQR